MQKTDHIKGLITNSPKLLQRYIQEIEESNKRKNQLLFEAVLNEIENMNLKISNIY